MSGPNLLTSFSFTHFRTVTTLVKTHRQCVHSYFTVLKLCVALPQIKICLLPGFSGCDQGNREIQVNAYGPPSGLNWKPDIKKAAKI